MIGKNKQNGWAFQLLDWLAALIAWVVFFVFRKSYIDPYQFEWEAIFKDGNFIIAIAFLPFLWVIWYMFTGQYHNAYRQSRIKSIFKTFWQVFVGVIIIFFVFLLDDQVKDYKNYYATFSFLLAIHFLLTVLFRVFYITWIKNKMQNGKLFIKAIVVGNKFRANQFYNDFENSPHTYGYQILGFVNIHKDNSTESNQFKQLGHLKDLEEICLQNDIEDVIIALDQKEHLFINRIILDLSLLNVNIKIIPELFEMLSGSVMMSEMIEGSLINVYPDSMSPFEQNIKRFVDLVISFFSIILLLPFFVIIALIIKLTDRGPVFYRQERVGQGAKLFQLYKFRSMKVNAEPNGPALSSDNDQRITKFGKIMRKWRLDELPQFWNVLKGDMSLIGPRPERQFFIAEMSKEAPQVKHLQRVKPGITSLGMVKYGYAQNIEQMIERLKFDILYIERRSLGLDFKIFLYTVVTLIRGRGI